MRFLFYKSLMDNKFWNLQRVVRKHFRDASRYNRKFGTKTALEFLLSAFLDRLANHP